MIDDTSTIVTASPKATSLFDDEVDDYDNTSSACALMRRSGSIRVSVEDQLMLLGLDHTTDRSIAPSVVSTNSGNHTDTITTNINRRRYTDADTYPILAELEDDSNSSNGITNTNDNNNSSSSSKMLSFSEKALLISNKRHSIDGSRTSNRMHLEKITVKNKDDDPLSQYRHDRYSSQAMTPDNFVSSDNNFISKYDNITIKLTDEARIVNALNDTIQKKSTGSVFSVKISISDSKSLRMGVKDLHDNMLLTVSMLKRIHGEPGPAEKSGLRLGDVIFGVNFTPTRDGSKTLLAIKKKEIEKGKKYLYLQCWRCVQLCSDPIPGCRFPRADDVIIQAYSLYKTKVFSDWERWNFVEILLGYLLEDLKMRNEDSAENNRNIMESSFTNSVDDSCSSSNNTPTKGIEKKKRKAKQMRILDLERNILQAKGLRNALCVRIVHTKMRGDTVVYVLRVEDLETGLQWVVHRRYRDFYTLNDELCDMSTFVKNAGFPKKTITLRNTIRLVEGRIVSLEQYIRRVLHVLTLYATMDPLASRSLRCLQTFLGVNKYIDCIHPPLVDDQRYIELMAYRFLNDFTSPACQQCVRFVTTVDLDPMITAGPIGYKSVLNHLRAALSEVELFVLQQHQQQMMQALEERKSDLNSEQARIFIRKCVRRQVEAALFLPLRRHAFRIVYSFLAEQAQSMQDALSVLQQAPPEYFMISPCVLQAKSLPKCIKAFRDLMHAFLPTDQGQLLMHAASSVMELHSECIQFANRKSSEMPNHHESLLVEVVKDSSNYESVSSLQDRNTVATTDSIDADDHSNQWNSNSKHTSTPSQSPRDRCTPNLMGKATLRDPVSEMFHSDETGAPEKVLDGVNECRYSHVCDDSSDRFANDSNSNSNSNNYIDLQEIASFSDSYRKADMLSDDIDTEGHVSSRFYDVPMKQTVVSADDFLPMFTYVLVQANLPQLLLVKELMTNFVDDEEMYGECGYYLATLEAATQHVCDLSNDYQKFLVIERSRSTHTDDRNSL